ncbi:sugar nucleotide-binding protein [Rhizomonospora bruguierae]|uniref:sugar nucleotide-binding protein n=1 Tax=Rhizomonospora bruguierae TaxID=1581705 RepID=UPI001BD0EA26|nr:sugar nucleotide-binding protein [Micromonospora sp. NBRC 107566]
MRLLVIGASGYLGGEVAARAATAGWAVTGTAFRGAGVPLDVRDAAAVRELVAQVRPDAVVNTAYAVDDWAVTADGPRWGGSLPARSGWTSRWPAACSGAGRAG